MEHCSDRIFAMLWDFPLAPDEDGEPMELPQDGPVLLKSEFQQFYGLRLNQVGIYDESRYFYRIFLQCPAIVLDYVVHTFLIRI